MNDPDPIGDPEMRDLCDEVDAIGAEIARRLKPESRKRRSVNRWVRASRDHWRIMFDRQQGDAGIPFAAVRYAEAWKERCCDVAIRMGATAVDLARASILAGNVHADYVAARLDADRAVQSGDPRDVFVALRRLYALERKG